MAIKIKSAIRETHRELLNFLLAIDKIAESIKKGAVINDRTGFVLTQDLSRVRTPLDGVFKNLEAEIRSVISNQQYPGLALQAIDQLKRDVDELANDIKTHFL